MSHINTILKGEFPQNLAMPRHRKYSTNQNILFLGLGLKFCLGMGLKFSYSKSRNPKSD